MYSNLEPQTKAVDENFSKNQQSSLNALLVLKSIVTTFAADPETLLVRVLKLGTLPHHESKNEAENVETRDNGNIIMQGAQRGEEILVSLSCFGALHPMQAPLHGQQH